MTTPVLSRKRQPKDESTQFPHRWRRSSRIMSEQANKSSISLPSRESHLVKSLPLLKTPLKSSHYAGHIPAKSTERMIFYWLFEAAKPTRTTPLLIWLNGGPGCSSMAGLFLENGPIRLVHDNKEWHIEENLHSWHNLPAHVLYIDQPVGTGLSFTTRNDYCRNDEEINEDLYAFLQNFLKVHQEVFVTNGKMNRKLFFSGESQAGHYIPSIMDYILKKNDSNSNDIIKINLAGGAIGNGWSDPYYQYSASLASYAKGIIDMTQWASLNNLEDQCQNELSKGNFNTNTCYQILSDIIKSSSGSKLGAAKVSYYDARLWEPESDVMRYPPGTDVLEVYLGNTLGASGLTPPLRADVPGRVLEAIHANATMAYQNFVECSDPPFFALQHQEGKGVVNEIKNILNHKDNVQLLFFNGMEDLICNHVGNEMWLDNLSWEHAEQWSLSKRFVWKTTKNRNEPAGYVKTYRNLSFLKIKDAGHMVPMDQPENAFDMMQTFINDSGQGFTKQDEVQNLNQAKPVSVGICETPGAFKRKQAFDEMSGRASRKIRRFNLKRNVL